MKLSDVLTIVAIVIGPIAALMIQRFLDKKREKITRQKDLFRTLWTTRAIPGRLQYRHVEALNMVPLDFQEKLKVVNAWREYLDRLNDDPEDEMMKQQNYRDRETKFIDLIFEMTQVLGYDIARRDVEKQLYSPVAHGTWAEQETILRESVIKLFKDEKALPIRLVSNDEQHT